MQTGPIPVPSRTGRLRREQAPKAPAGSGRRAEPCATRALPAVQG